MPNTGHFYLFNVTGQRDPSGHLLQVTLVECACLSCSRTFIGYPGHGLIDLERGAVVICPSCFSRQAISMARFDDFLVRRSPGDCPP